MTKGLFITLEGPEGAGKTTQAKLLTSWLREWGKEVVLTREPGATELGKGIRELVLHQGHMVPEAEFLLYSADRAEHFHQVIAPALTKGQVVVCDRWLDSSLAYQGYGRGLSLEWILQVSEGFLQGARPLRTFVFDIAPEAGLARFASRDRLEREPLDFHQRVRQGFLSLAASNPERYVVLNAQQSIEALQSEMRNHVLSLINKG